MSPCSTKGDLNSSGKSEAASTLAIQMGGGRKPVSEENEY